MLAVNFALLVLCLIGRLKAEYCTQDGYNKVCLISSESDLSDGESLGDIVAELNKNDTVRIDIEIPHLCLTENVSFDQLYSLMINGNSNSSTTINCTNSDGNTGIIFTEIMSITLSNLRLTSCGSKSFVRQKMYSSALRVLSCGDIHFTNLVITKSYGIGLMILNHLSGTVHIAWSNFTDNRISEPKLYGGGGVYVGEFEPNSSLPVQLEFEHCVFERNVAHTRHYHNYYTDEFGNSQSGHGQGGGVFLAFERNITNSNVIVLFSYCTFTKNQAFFGGGLSIRMGAGKAQVTFTKIIVTVENSIFEMNGCNKTTSNSWHARIGGGAYLSYYSIKSLDRSGSEYNFRNVTFSENCAEFGGGVYFFSYRQISGHNSLRFNKCTFKKNRAHMGSAIDLTPSSFIKLSAGEIPIPVFTNCTFMENTVSYNSDSNQKQRATGIGTLFASLYDVKFEEMNYFQNNNGTGVYMVNGVADFSNSSAIFSGNDGIRGGAIALIGASAVVVGSNRDYKFENNRAHFQGGAIYVLMINNHDFTVSRSCFIQYFDGSNFRVTGDWNSNITFVGNQAQVGHAIFATSLHPCQGINNNTTESPFFTTVNASEVFSFRGILVNESEIATEGAQLHYEQEVLHTIPGQQYYHGVKLKDDISKPVNEPLRTNILPDKIRNTDYTVSLDPAFSLYVREKIQLNGTPGGEADILLQTVSNRQSYTILKVVLEECPPGFELKKGVCICNSNDYFGLIECNVTDFFSYLTPGLWIGIINESNVTELVTNVCPHSYCNYSEMTIRGVVLPKKSSDLDKSMCGESREGVMCGRCRDRYTVHFHSPKFQCRLEDNLCKVGWLFYILSELVPVTVVFIIITVFNISFTSGAVNGFILFSQVLLSLNIDASGIITFPNQRLITEGYELLYGFLNLDFFTTETMSFCLWPNATALDMLAFKYITIVYALSLVILVIWFMNKCGGRCLGKWWRITTVKSSIIHGISAFFIICYSQSIKVSHSLVTYSELWLKEGSNTIIARRVWLNGNIVYFSIEHILYALPALFCLLTIGTIPPLLLLVYPLFNKVLAFLGYEESRLVNCISQRFPINSLKPLLDAFQGCFKDNLRFFAGFYFLYRWMAPIVYSTFSSLGSAYIITEILLILILAIHAFSQPYMKRAHNMVDTILFTDLLLINSITCIHYFLFQSQENRHTVEQKVAKTSIIQAILIYLPFAIMAIYILVLGCIRVYYSFHKKCASRRGNILFEEEMSPSTTQTLRRLRAAVHSISSINGDISINDEELPHRLITGQVRYEHFKDTDYAQEDTY